MALLPSSMMMDTIDTDRPCQSCGYNLRGLTTSSRCPECGAPISRRSGRRGKFIKPIAFTDLPPSTIRRFMPGFYLAAMSCTGVFVMAIGGMFSPLTAAQSMWVMTGTVAMWAIGSWLMMAPIDIPAAADVGFSRSCRLRIAARWLQIGWLIEWGAVALIRFGGITGGLEKSIHFVGVLGGVAGFVGVAILAVMLARFASWVCDDFAEKCFNFHFGGVAILTPIYFLGSAFAAPLFPIFMVILLFVGGVWLISLLALPVGLLSLSRSIGWSVRHAKDRLARDMRLAARVAGQPLSPQPVSHEDLSTPIHMSDEAVHHDINYSGTVPIAPGAGAAAAGAGGPAAPVGRRTYHHEAGDASHPQHKEDEGVF